MNAQSLAEPQIAATRGDQQSHVMTCHDPDLALCGTDIGHLAVIEDEETTCVVCADLDEMDCGLGDGYCGCLCCVLSSRSTE